MRNAIAAIGLLSAGPLWAAAHRPAIREGFEHVLQSRICEAAADPALHNHLAQTILYRAFYRSGLLKESIVSGRDPLLLVDRLPKLHLAPDEDREFHHAVATAMAIGQERLRVCPSDTSALFALGSTYALRANYKFLVRKAWIPALRDAGAGLRLHNRVAQLEPANLDAQLLQGMHDYVLAKLPLTLRVLGVLAGMHGNRERGLRTVALVAEHGATKRGSGVPHCWRRSPSASRRTIYWPR